MYKIKFEIRDSWLYIFNWWLLIYYLFIYLIQKSKESWHFSIFQNQKSKSILTLKVYLHKMETI